MNAYDHLKYKWMKHRDQFTEKDKNEIIQELDRRIEETKIKKAELIKLRDEQNGNVKKKQKY